MKSIDRKKLKRSMSIYLIWAAAAILAMGGVTYAWFTFRTAVNLTPTAGAIGSGGADLLISNDEHGAFEPYAELLTEGTYGSMYPVSTADLITWSSAIYNDRNGICTKFSDVTEGIDEKTLHGRIYLKAEGGDCAVYFNRSDMSFGDNGQMIAACRLAVEGSSETDGPFKYIFSLDAFGDGVHQSVTMQEENVVIDSIDGGGNAVTVPDPSVPVAEYCGFSEENLIYPGEKPICNIRDGEVIGIDYRLYMEGCDENCCNEAMDTDIDLRLGFAGIEADE